MKHLVYLYIFLYEKFFIGIAVYGHLYIIQGVPF